MQDILEQIIATKREEVAALRLVGHASERDSSNAALVGHASERDEDATVATLGGVAHYGDATLGGVAHYSLRAALLNSPTGIIAEFKRRSPSKGWIKEEGRPDVIPLSYQQNGAAALSILTDEHYFGGCDDFIREARASGVTLPILYKNFVIDEVQLHAAVNCGASAVLLIAACLSKADCKRLLDKAHALGLEVLLEMHSEEELEYATLGPDLCGINNRHLGSFHTDVETSFRLAEKLCAVVGHASERDESLAAATLGGVAHYGKTAATLGGVAHYGKTAATLGGVAHYPVLVSESGISDPQTVKALRAAGFRGFLIGETFMKTPDPGLALHDFLAQLS